MTSSVHSSSRLLFKNVDKLQWLSLSGYDKSNGESVRDVLACAGIVLRNITDYDVRKIFGAALYGAGLQDYAEGRVSERRVWKNTLWGKVDASGRKWLPRGSSQFLEPNITLERNSKSPRISGSRACSIASEGSLCPHMATLMIAWVRRPSEFTVRADVEAKRVEFDEAKKRVTDSLNELVNSISSGSSMPEDFRILQDTYSKMKSWTADLSEAEKAFVDQGNDLIRMLSVTLNSVSFSIMSAICAKYGVGALDLYNKSTVATLGKVLELLIASDGSMKSLPAQNKPKRKIVKLSRTVRSWDTLIENFDK